MDIESRLLSGADAWGLSTESTAGRVSAGGGGQRVALGRRAHTGWAALVAVAGGVARPDVLLRCRVELGDPSGRVRRNVYQAARGLKPAAAARLVWSLSKMSRHFGSAWWAE